MTWRRPPPPAWGARTPGKSTLDLEWAFLGCSLQGAVRDFKELSGEGPPAPPAPPVRLRSHGPAAGALRRPGRAESELAVTAGGQVPWSTGQGPPVRRTLPATPRGRARRLLVLLPGPPEAGPSGECGRDLVSPTRPLGLASGRAFPAEPRTTSGFRSRAAAGPDGPAPPSPSFLGPPAPTPPSSAPAEPWRSPGIREWQFKGRRLFASLKNHVSHVFGWSSAFGPGLCGSHPLCPRGTCPTAVTLGPAVLAARRASGLPARPVSPRGLVAAEVGSLRASGRCVRGVGEPEQNATLLPGDLGGGRARSAWPLAPSTAAPVSAQDHLQWTHSQQ